MRKVWSLAVHYRNILIHRINQGNLPSYLASWRVRPIVHRANPDTAFTGNNVKNDSTNEEGEKAHHLRRAPLYNCRWVGYVGS